MRGLCGKFPGLKKNKPPDVSQSRFQMDLEWFWKNFLSLRSLDKYSLWDSSGSSFLECSGSQSDYIKRGWITESSVFIKILSRLGSGLRFITDSNRLISRCKKWTSNEHLQRVLPSPAWMAKLQFSTILRVRTLIMIVYFFLMSNNRA